MAEPLSFRAYARQWLHAAGKAAWDTFGVASTVVGAFIWAWKEYFPENFQWAAGQFRLSPDDVSTDLVWQVPLAVGLAVLAFRLIRAPYEMYVEADRKASDMLATANARIAELERTNEFSVKTDHAHYYFKLNDPEKPEQRPGVWVIVSGVTITNLVDKPVPVRVWVYIAPTSDGWRTGFELLVPPAWALDESVQGTALPSVLNLSGRFVASGFCAVNIGHDTYKQAANSDLETLGGLPVWIEVENEITQESKAYSLNYVARNLDRARGKNT